MQHSIPIVSAILMIVLLTMLAACGGGGGSGGGGAAGDSAGPVSPVQKTLGTREFEGFHVVVQRSDPLAPGALCRLTATVTPTDDQAIASVTAWIESEFQEDPLGTAGTPAVGQADTFAWTLTIPDPLPATVRLRVRVTGTAGTIAESGIEDFALAP